MSGSAGGPGAQGTVRRVIVFVLLAVLVGVAASGVAGLLSRLFETRPEFVSDGGELALSLAFALIGVPLALLLWWFAWRRLEGPDRASVAWGLYLALMLTVSLVTFVSYLLTMFNGLVERSWSPDALGGGIAWLLVWVSHRWAWVHHTRSPLRLTTVPLVLGAAYGLGVGVTGAIAALGGLFDAAFLPSQVEAGLPWWTHVLQGTIGFVVGAAIWWWHWVRENARDLNTVFAGVMLVLTGIAGGAAITLYSVGVMLFVGLRASFDQSDPWPTLLDPLGPAIASTGVGLTVWVFHRGVARMRSDATHSATRLVEAGVGLIGAATGLGVVINALLASFTEPLAGQSDIRTLLLSGIAALVVGAPAWWIAWRASAADADGSARRIYLIAVFGVSAVVALIALLVIGYRIFELLLGAGAGGPLLERIRAPFGLLVATGLAAGYHFAVWHRERATGAAPATGTAGAADGGAAVIGEVIVVIGAEAADVIAALSTAVRSVTGGRVTVWSRADVGGGAATMPAPETIAAALAGLTARRVLLLVAPSGALEAIPLT